MRPIKFRAWRMLDDYSGRMETHEHENEAGDFLNEAFSAGMPIMQFTGLQDKNGVDIFEGDIGWDDHNEYHGEVVFEDGAFRYLWDNINELLDECASGIAIVGTIYENPELLKRIDGSGAGDESTASEQREIEGNDTANPGLRSEQ